MKLRRSAIAQYALIYLMYIIPGSCLFAKFLQGEIKYLALLALYGFLFVRYRKYRSGYALRFVALFTVSVLFTRFYTGGGAGINSLFQFLVCVLSTQMAIYCDKEKFLTRWVKFVTVMAAISIVFWAAFFAVPSLVNAYPATVFKTQDLGSVGYEVEYHGRGLLIYSYLEIHPIRNCGVFTEPGVHQVILNMTLYVLLFWQDRLSFKENWQYRLCVAIVLLAIVTCQSTTGYMGFIMVLAFFFFSSKAERKYKGIKQFMVTAVTLGLVVLLGDYAARGDDSILYSQFIYKLFGSDGGGLDVSEGTGQYRMGTMMVCLDIMMHHPLGVGYDIFNLMKNAYAEGLVAASFLQFPAVFGVLPWLLLMSLLFLPVLTRMKAGPAFLFIFLFINTTLAQTDLMYPAFCMIPMCLVGVPMAEEKPEEKTEEKPEGKEEAADEQNADPVYGQ